MAKEASTSIETDSLTAAISRGIEAAYEGSILTPLELRLAIMDYPDVNIPLYTEHLSDEELWKCIQWSCEHFNEIQPQISKKYTLKNFPRHKLLLDGAIVEAFKLTALKELRGEMQYSDGGIQSSIYYKSPQFTQLRQELQQSVEQQSASIKRALNLDLCYGALC